MRQLGIIARRGERERDAVHDRHADVGEQEIEATLLAREQIERLAAVGSGHDLMAVDRERARAKRAERVFVFGYENACHGDSSQRVPATTSRRLTKRTSTSRASVRRRGEAAAKANALARRQRGARGTAVQE